MNYKDSGVNSEDELSEEFIVLGEIVKCT